MTKINMYVLGTYLINALYLVPLLIGPTAIISIALVLPNY